MDEMTEEVNIQGTVLEAFRRLSSKEVEDLSGLITGEALKKGFTYQRPSGKIEPINLMLVPSFFTEAQAVYVKDLSLAIKRGIEAVYRAWFHDPALAKTLPFEEDEFNLIRGLHRETAAGEPIWFRLDSHFHMKEKDWQDKISFFEVNSCAVGGIHYCPVAEELFTGIIYPFIKKHLPSSLRTFRRNPDFRDLLRLLISRHATAIGRRTLNIAYAEDTTAQEGITEGPYIVDYLRSQGLNISLVDPRDLYVKKDEVYYKDQPLDIIYRNFELREIIEMETNGDNTSGIRHAFSHNQVISSLCGDFDHKSMWEALASGRFDRYFSKEDSRLFKKHLLWTWIVRECVADGPDGFKVDLIPYAVRNKDTLVLKPNRLCGGYGVTIGPVTEQKEWESLIEKALKEEGGWVLQRYGAPEEFTFPLFEDGKLLFEKHNIVYGLSSTPDGAGLLGRVSRQRVVNVAQHGGLMPVLRV